MTKRTFLLKGEKFKQKWNRTDFLDIVAVVLHSLAQTLKENENSVVNILFMYIYMSSFASIRCQDLSLCAEFISLVILWCLLFPFKILFDYHTILVKKAVCQVEQILESQCFHSYIHLCLDLSSQWQPKEACIILFSFIFILITILWGSLVSECVIGLYCFSNGWAGGGMQVR